MKTRKMMLKALCAIALAAMVSVGCQETIPLEINSPEDLQEKIDAYAAEKAEAESSDGPVAVTVTKREIGASDYSTGWWGDHSQSFEIPAGKLLHIEFDNWGSRENNWNNWNLALATVGGGIHSVDDDANYSEYFIMRSDLYGWGNTDYDGGLINSNYAEAIGEVDDMWAVFRDAMYGAHVTIELDHSTLGSTYMTATAVSEDGAYTLTETYNHPTPTTSSVYAFLITDSSYMVMDADNCWTEPSKVKEILDYDVEALSVTGFPAVIEVGNYDFDSLVEASGIKAVATFADGSSAEIPVEEIDFTVSPAFGSVVGEETVLYSYSGTKLGAYGKSVAGVVKISVVNPVASIEAVANAYLIGKATHLVLSPSAIIVKCTYSDGSEGTLNPAQYTITYPEDNPVYEGVVGTVENAFTVTHVTASGNEITANGTLVIAESALPAQEGIVGLEDNTTPWWAHFTQDWKVEEGTSQSISYILGSSQANVWNVGSAIVRMADNTEYGVFRMDGYAWQYGLNTNDNLDQLGWVLANDWPEDLASHLDGSKVSVTVANNGGYASVRFHVIFPNGDVHYQYFDNIAVDSGNVQFAMVTDGSHLDFTGGGEEPTPGDVTVSGLVATANAYLIGGAGSLTLSKEAVNVYAVYSDLSQKQLKSSEFTISYTGNNAYVAEANGLMTDLAEVSYETFKTGVNVNVKKSEQEGQATRVGADDFSNGWWTTFSKDWKVAAGESQTVSLTVHSAGVLNHQSPCVILRKADNTEYAVVRMDNYGWLYATNTFEHLDQLGWVLSSDWNWEAFLANIDGSKVTVTVANDGNGKASIRYNVEYSNGEKHFQYYDNIVVDSSDVQFAFVTEASYLDFD